MVSQSPPLLGAADLVRRARERRGLSARAASLRAGQSASYVTRLEAGSIQPSLRAFAKLALALRLNPAEIALVVISEARAAGSYEQEKQDG